MKEEREKQESHRKAHEGLHRCCEDSTAGPTVGRRCPLRQEAEDRGEAAGSRVTFMGEPLPPIGDFVLAQIVPEVLSEEAAP